MLENRHWGNNFNFDITFVNYLYLHSNLLLCPGCGVRMSRLVAFSEGDRGRPGASRLASDLCRALIVDFPGIVESSAAPKLLSPAHFLVSIVLEKY